MTKTKATRNSTSSVEAKERQLLADNYHLHRWKEVDNSSGFSDIYCSLDPRNNQFSTQQARPKDSGGQPRR